MKTATAKESKIILRIRSVDKDKMQQYLLTEGLSAAEYIRGLIAADLAQKNNPRAVAQG